MIQTESANLHRFQKLLLDLRHQAFELPLFQADGVLTVTSFLARDVPVRHPAELFAFAGFQDDQEWIEGHFFLLFSHPGFQLLREQGRDDFVIGVTSAQLKIETNVKVASATTFGAFVRCGSGEVVQRVEQLLVRRIFLMTLNAVKKLRSHVRLSFPGIAELSCQLPIATA